MSRRHLGRIAALATAGLLCLGSAGSALAQQQAWRGFDVPAYPSATHSATGQDLDDYEIRFQSQDDPKAVYDFYKNYLVQQGFTVVNEKTKRHGFKADLTRGQGGPDDRIELDVKRKDGRFEVEIEFDD